MNRNLLQRTRDVSRFVPRGNQTRVGNLTPINGRGKATLKPEGISKLKNPILRKPVNPNLVKKDKIKILPHPGFKGGKGHKHVHKKWWLAHPLLIKHKWCGYYPIYCHWWYDFCTPIRYCAPVHCVYYTYDYVHCGGGFWYLGLKGTLLPGKGVGIKSVEAGSPAALAGLKPGMVITRTNDVPLVDDQSMPTAIANSDGVLNLAVLSAADSKPSNVRVAMRRMATKGF
ncbi:MAG: PDZ domain-containing protein [Pirellulales bacterium]|nr:PDZ domain-containing protein [Pirellulales bacterium]